MLQIDSKNFPATANTGMAYFEMQKYDKSIPFFEEAIKLDSANPWWYNYLSQAMQKCEDYMPSLDNAWQAVLLGKKDNSHHLNMAYTIYEISGEIGRENTDSYLEKWYEKFPENPIAQQCYKSFFYDENFSCLGSVSIGNGGDGYSRGICGSDTTAHNIIEDHQNCITEFHITFTDPSAIKYIRISSYGHGNYMTITINEPIINKKLFTN
jgi:tetratricopeptide (TPR) repeat protein